MTHTRTLHPDQRAIAALGRPVPPTDPDEVLTAAAYALARDGAGNQHLTRALRQALDRWGMAGHDQAWDQTLDQIVTRVRRAGINFSQEWLILDVGERQLLRQEVELTRALEWCQGPRGDRVLTPAPGPIDPPDPPTRLDLIAARDRGETLAFVVVHRWAVEERPGWGWVEQALPLYPYRDDPYAVDLG